jgi:hypothetical protein
LRQINLKNSDTIINRTEAQIIKITNFNNTFSKKNVVENKDNWFSNFKEIFKNYAADESPIGWLSGYPIRKNLTTAELDFFAHKIRTNIIFRTCFTKAIIKTESKFFSY